MLAVIPELTDHEVSPGAYLAHQYTVEGLGYVLRDVFDPGPMWQDVLDKKMSADDFIERLSTEPQSYGVCDTLDQITTRWPVLAQDDGREFVILVREEVRTEGDKGFRWHKEGKYIGNLPREHENFGDETAFERVFLFSIYQVTYRP